MRHWLVDSRAAKLKLTFTGHMRVYLIQKTQLVDSKTPV
jgi:hypothetical protein